MFKNLAKCACTRRATASLAFRFSLPTAHVKRRLYATGNNTDILNLLKECEKKEQSSWTKNRYKIRSFRAAAAAIEVLDFTVRHGDDLKGVPSIGPGIRSRINVVLGHEKTPHVPALEPFIKPEDPKRTSAVKTLMTIPGLGEKGAKALYDSGCDTVEKLKLKKYKGTLSPGAKRGLKYLDHLQNPVPRENAERLVEFCKDFIPMDGYEIIIAGAYRRGEPTLREPIELLIIDKTSTDPIPTPPHPSTLIPPSSRKPTRLKLPFSQYYMKNEAKANSVLLREFIRPLERRGVVSDMTTPGTNVWQGWVRVPKKNGELWETSRDRLRGIEKVNGEFHRVNITYVPKKSKGATLLALTGDEYYYFDCRRKAVDDWFYLNEWGLWEWEHDPESHSRIMVSASANEKVSLGEMWGAETEEGKGRWVLLETFEEEQILDTIGAEYVPPERRNFRYIAGNRRREGGPVVMRNA